MKDGRKTEECWRHTTQWEIDCLIARHQPFERSNSDHTHPREYALLDQQHVPEGA